MQRFRRIVFFGFVTLYFILCPLTILYALGYVLLPGEPRFVKTGLISIATTPSDAAVYVGNRRFDKRTPVTIRALRPGDYTVRVTLKQHRPWMRKVHVEAEKAAVFQHVLLLPQQWTQRSLLDGPWSQMTLVPQSRLLLLNRGNSLGEMIVYDWRQERSWPLLASTSSWSEATVASVMPVRDEPCVVLRVRSRRGEEDLWVDLRSKEARLQSLGAFPPHAIEGVGELIGDRHQLFVLDGTTLRRLKPLINNGGPTALASDLSGFGMIQRRLYGLTAEGQLQRIDPDSQTVDVIEESPWLRPVAESAKRPLELLGPTPEALLLRDGSGALWSTQPPERLIERGVEGVAWSADHRQLLVWTRQALGVVEWIRSSDGEEALPVSQPRLRWLLQDVKGLRHAWWVYEDSHVLLQQGDELSLLEVESGAAEPPVAVVAIKPRTRAAYVEDDGTLYSLDADTGALTALLVVPSHGLLTLPFPESESASR